MTKHLLSRLGSYVMRRLNVHGTWGQAAITAGVIGVLLAGGAWVVAINTTDPRVVWIALVIAFPMAVLAGPFLGRRGRLSVGQILAVTSVGIAMFFVTMVSIGVALVMRMGPIGPDNDEAAVVNVMPNGQ